MQDASLTLHTAENASQPAEQEDGRSKEPRHLAKIMAVQQNRMFDRKRNSESDAGRYGTQDAKPGGDVLDIRQDARPSTGCRVLHWTLERMLYAYAAKDALYV